MPRFGSFLTKINEKLEEAKISDLNHELGKWVQGSHACLDNFKSDAANVGNLIKIESNRIGGRLWSRSDQSGTGGGIPKSLSLPSFSSALSSPSDVKTRDTSRKYRYKSGKPNQLGSFFDEVDENLLKGVNVEGSNIELQKKSDVVEKFIKVIENKDSGPSSLSTSITDKIASPPNSKREDIRKKLAGLGEPLEPQRKDGLLTESIKRGNDLEVCYINETILEEDDNGLDEREDEQPEYHYEEDYRSHFPVRASLPRSKTDWEAFKRIDNSVEDQPYSSASPNSSPPLSPPSSVSPTIKLPKPAIQCEAAVALANCPKIARRKLLILKQKQLETDENQLEKILGKKITKDKQGRFTEESLLNLNAPTLQVIVNDFHSKIESLNEELVHLVIEKDELQIEQDSQLVDIDDLQVPQRRH